MHEIALVDAAAKQLVKEVDGAVIARVVMAIGPDVEHDVARTAWEVAVAGSSVEGAELELVDAKDLLRCLDCSEDFAGVPLDTCPSCGGNGLVVEAADEVSITSWTV